MKLSKYYTKAVIYPSLFIQFFNIVYSFLDNYKNDPLSVTFVLGSSILPSFIYSLLVCALSLTIFLNKIKKLHKNIIWNLLNWFLLPFSYIFIILHHDMGFRIKHSFGFGNDFLYLLIITIPYGIGLGWTFIKFRKEVTTNQFSNKKVSPDQV